MKMVLLPQEEEDWVSAYNESLMFGPTGYPFRSEDFPK